MVICCFAGLEKRLKRSCAESSQQIMQKKGGKSKTMFHRESQQVKKKPELTYKVLNLQTILGLLKKNCSLSIENGKHFQQKGSNFIFFVYSFSKLRHKSLYFLS